MNCKGNYEWNICVCAIYLSPASTVRVAHLCEFRRRLLTPPLHRRLQVYNLETSYLNDSNTHGNVLKGFEGFLAQHKATS